MHFRNFDVCLGGKWVEKSCDKDSLFWVVINCCIPIYKYPTFDECVNETASTSNLEKTKETSTPIYNSSPV